MSYRNPEEMMAEHGVVVDHSMIHWWAVRYSPELLGEPRRGKRPESGSWRVDETYTKVKGAWKYLDRAVDKDGKTVDLLLSAKRDTTAAYRFFLKALGSSGVPKKLTMDMSGSRKAAAHLFVEELSAGGKRISTPTTSSSRTTVE